MDKNHKDEVKVVTAISKSLGSLPQLSQFSNISRFGSIRSRIVLVQYLIYYMFEQKKNNV